MDKQVTTRKRTRKYDVKLATWNVRTLLRAGAFKNLEKELGRYGIKLAAVQEIRWKESLTMDGKEFTLFSSGSDGGKLGVGFMVHKSLKPTIIDFVPISGRLCTIRMKWKCLNMTIISAHAPTEETAEEDKDAFYAQLERCYESAPRHDVKLILGDLNANVGNEEEFRPTTGGFSAHDESNDNGMRLVDFAMGRRMTISSTYFRHKRIHKTTWNSPDGITKKQIDHVLVNRRHGSDIMDVKTCRGADVDSDHDLVVVKYRQRLSVQSQRMCGNSARKLLVMPLIGNQEARDRFQEELNGAMACGVVSPGVEEHWQEIKNAMNTSAEKSLGFEVRERCQPWFDQECVNALEERRKAREKLLQHDTRHNRQNFREQRRKAKKVCRRKKRAMEKEKISQIEQCHDGKDVHKMYLGLKGIKRGFEPNTSMCRAKDGSLLGEAAQVRGRWAEYFSELLNEGPPDEEFALMDDQVELDEPTLFEVREAIKSLNIHKAAGEDNLPAELFKYGGDRLAEEMHKLICNIWRTEVMPIEWNTAVIVPLHKKGDKLNCANYRGISLLNIGYKILAKVLAGRLKPLVEELLGEYQCGFRSNRSTTDQLFTLRMILEKCYEFNVTVHQLFIDFRAAYDQVYRGQLYRVMQNEFNIPTKLVKLIKMTHNGTECRVRVKGELTDSFQVRRGLKQGDSLSSLLFNLALEAVIRKCRINQGGCIFNRTSQNLAFADDVNVIAMRTDYLREHFDTISTEAAIMGLEVSRSKTKYMINSRNKTRWRNVTNFEGFERVKQFKYLGSIVTEDNEVQVEIQARVAAGNRCYYSFLGVLKSSLVSKSLKIKLYETIIRPVVIYGSETWTLTNRNINMLEVLERKILRKIFGAVQEDGGWRIRTNEELRTMYNKPGIINVIKAGRLRWLGHVERMEEWRMPRKILYARPEGQRTTGRLRLRWMDGVVGDLKKLNVRDWKRRAR